MSTLVNLFSTGWATFWGLSGVVILVIGFLIFWQGWPTVSPFIQRILASAGDWLEYNLSLELSGWKVISQSAPALIFLATIAVGVHIMDKHYLLKQDREVVCKAMMDDLYKQYKFVPKAKPQSKGWFK